MNLESDVLETVQIGEPFKLTPTTLSNMSELIPGLVPPTSGLLEDYPVTGGLEIAAATREASQDAGAVLMSSGGTTGAPKLAWLPHGFGLSRVLEEWKPLSENSVLLNLFNPGKLWGSHYYMQQLAADLRCTVLPTGPFSNQDIRQWAPVVLGVGVNALAGNPTVIADFAEGCLQQGITFPIRDIIWMAEPWSSGKKQLVQQAFPDARFWGNYGAVETWVMATNTPFCHEATFHLLADQVMEPRLTGSLLTRIGINWPVPLIRYNTRDIVEPSSCKCGRDRAIRVLGRAGDSFMFRSANIQASDVVEAAQSVDGVQGAQIIARGGAQAESSVIDTLIIEYTANGVSGSQQVLDLNSAVHDAITQSILHISAVVRAYPLSLQTRLVDTLVTVPRTGKTPTVRWD